ncbi:hypothetical protein [Pantoea agglomerans]
MISESPIDTSTLLTILGLIAAVWAIVPSSTRLRFKLSVTWSDWLIVSAVFIVIHYLLFENILKSLGLYYSFGPWKWGFDKNSAIYILFVVLSAFILIRARAPKIARRNIADFAKLVDRLLLTKRYDELVSIVEPQFSKLLSFRQEKSFIARILNKISQHRTLDIESILNGANRATESRIKSSICKKLYKLDSIITKNHKHSIQTDHLLRSLYNSEPFVTYLASAYPDFGLRMLEKPEVVREDFLEIFINALLVENSSRLYIELKNNKNLNGTYRLALPENNKILCYFFKDVTVARNHALYRAIGESTLRMLEEDKRIAEKHNRSLSYIDDYAKYKSPIYAAVNLFEIMIHEGIHQVQQDHLWLYYFNYFTNSILLQLRDKTEDDVNHEFPTLFHFIIFEMVSTTSNWINDCLEINIAELPETKTKRQGFNAYYISESAAKSQGILIQSILNSPKIDKRFKSYMLEIALQSYIKIKDKPEVASVRHNLKSSLINGIDNKTKPEYRQELRNTFMELDHVIRLRIPEFASQIDESLR